MDLHWHQMNELYRHLEDQNCICVYGEGTVENVWFECFQETFKKGSVSSEENKILCIRLIGLACEVYFRSVSYTGHACNNLIYLFKSFHSLCIWDELVYILRSSDNKFLVWCVVKSLTALVYASGQPCLSHVDKLLTDIKNELFFDENLNVVDFLSSIVKYQHEPETKNGSLNICSNVSSCIITPPHDLFQFIQSILSQYWDSLLAKFHHICSSSSGTQKVTPFLLLWQNLIQKQTRNLLFINETCVVHFFTNACLFNVISLQIYADIIMQFFVVTAASELNKEENKYFISKAVCDSINSVFFEKLPQGDQSCSFIIPRKKRLEGHNSQNSSKCDPVITKKISFICLNGLIGTKDKSELCNALLKIFAYMKHNFELPPSTLIHTCILQIFIDQDDLLFGVMLVSLKIYNLLKIEENLSDSFKAIYCHVRSELNPHLMFISFLMQIGFDYNELLSFLTSDETCFLLYLLLYTKTLLNEKDCFVLAHNSLLCADTVYIETATNNCNLELISASDNKNMVDYSSSSVEKPKTIVSYTSSPGEKPKNIVSYSSSSDEEPKNIGYSSRSDKEPKNVVGYSSSSDEEPELLLSVVSKSCDTNKSFKELKVIRMLSGLRKAIQKLVDVNEFPYVVSPLLSSLLACENL